MKITCITVCVNFSDYLAWTVPLNKDLFNKWIIVTDKSDLKTKNICSHYGVQCIQTDIFYKNKGFNKFAGINVALEEVPKDHWVLFLDADIVLPPISKRVFNELNLNPEKIYGIDRLSCKGFQKWVEFCNNPELIIDNWLLTNGGMELGGRINHYYGQWGENGKFDGWKPLGFFQLVHKSQFTEYPENSNSADHCDLVFVKNWHRSKRELIPEIVGIHLEDTSNEWGKDWNGRKTKLFHNVFYSTLEKDYPCDLKCKFKRFLQRFKKSKNK